MPKNLCPILWPQPPETRRCNIRKCQMKLNSNSCAAFGRGRVNFLLSTAVHHDRGGQWWTNQVILWFCDSNWVQNTIEAMLYIVNTDISLHKSIPYAFCYSLETNVFSEGWKEWISMFWGIWKSFNYHLICLVWIYKEYKFIFIWCINIWHWINHSPVFEASSFRADSTSSTYCTVCTVCTVECIKEDNRIHLISS